MSKTIKPLAIALSLILLLSFALTGCVKAKSPDEKGEDKGTNTSADKAPIEDEETANPTGDKKVIVVDGGGDIVQFNSTKSMEKTESNPYPYNELELLSKEWMEKHPGVEIKILETSKSKERDTLVPLFKAKKAPDIVFQNPGVYRNSDLDQKWTVALNEYLEKPNKYIEGNTKWIDTFNPMWLNAIRSMDGNYYFIPLDSIPVGIIYNKELFAKAGIEAPPETFSQFMEAQEKLKNIGVIPYLPIYHWYDIFLEGTFMSSKLPELDTIIKDGIVDAQEIARGFDKGILTLDCPEYREYLKFMKEKTKYYPKGWQTANVFDSFVQGEIGMVEAVGIHMRMVQDDTKRKFEVGTMAFPLPTEEDSKYAQKGVIRGSAGYSTCWQISNSAVEKGTVDLCVDFLQYITTPENNSRLVNKLSATAPAVMGSEPVDLFKPLQKLAENDMENGFLDWHAFAAFAAFDAEVLDGYEKDLYPSYLLGKISEDQFIQKGEASLKKAVERFKKTSQWDTSKW